MNNVMTNGFAELNEKEMEELNGGWGVSFKLGPVSFSVSDKDVKSAVKWYKNTYVPKAERFGAKVYDWLH